MRLMYWYALTPVVVIFGGLVFLTAPYLALAVLTIIALGLLAALVWAIVAVPYMLGHAISRRWQARSSSTAYRSS
jgi:drug/metabolite transporter (DMT)-like permease